MKKFSEFDFVCKAALTDYLCDEIQKECKVSDIVSILNRVIGMDIIYCEHVDGNVKDSFSDIFMVLRKDEEKIRTYLLVHFLIKSDELDVFGNYDKWNPGIICEHVLLDIPINDVLFACDIVPSVNRIAKSEDSSYLDKCEKNRIDFLNRISTSRK